MKCNLKMDLRMFGDKDFFSQAFEEAYAITEPNVEDSVANEGDSEIEPIETPVEEKETVVDPVNELTKEEIKEMYEKYYNNEENVDNEEEEEYDEEVQSALELFKYLESNPHLVQAMQNVDPVAYQQLNSYVPDEVTKRINELESFKQDYEYEKYISDLKSRYSDFDEDKVLEYGEEHDIVNLEVAYKAMKVDTVKEPNIDELRAQIKAELMEELKNNSIQTQSIVGGINQKPINQDAEVNLSNKEQRIARAMGISPNDYAKWR